VKGTLFQRPLELKLNIEGENWRQGAVVSGVLTFKNHGQDPLPLAGFGVCLAQGHLKSVRLNAANAFRVLSFVPAELKDSLEPHQEISVPWTLPLDGDCAISDATSSLFVLYGRGQDPAQLGALQLLIEPAEIIDEIVKTLGIIFRFSVKTRKAGKDGVEIKFTPPDAPSFRMLEQLVLSFRVDAGAIHLKYVFQVKKIEATAASFDISKAKKEFEQTLQVADLRLPSGRPNYGFMESALREVVSHVDTKVIL